jgi:large subunit ribosomal protein L24
VKIVAGDTVKVIAGADKGKTGKVLHVYPEKDRLVVEKIALMKRHTKPSRQVQQGGIIEREAPIHVSNVMLLDPKSGDATRVGMKQLGDGKRARVARKSGEIISRPEE